MFDQRIMNLMEAVASLDAAPQAAPLVHRTLDLMREVDEAISDTSSLRTFTTMEGDLNDTFEDAFVTLRSFLREPTDEAGFEWSHKVGRTFAFVLESISQLVNLEDTIERRLGELAFHALTVAERATMLLDNAAIRKSAEVALGEATDAAEKAKDAAGITGGASISEHFATYSKSELRSANIFRILTIVGVLGALAIALGLKLPEAGDWTGLAFRLAILAAFGTLSAYFARQAGQHRRMFNWARSMEIQLKSFPAFIEPIALEERGDIYRAFARRVLGSPPEKDGTAADDAMPATQLLDLVVTLAKRSQSSAGS